MKRTRRARESSTLGVIRAEVGRGLNDATITGVPVDEHATPSRLWQSVTAREPAPPLGNASGSVDAPGTGGRDEAQIPLCAAYRLVLHRTPRGARLIGLPLAAAM